MAGIFPDGGVECDQTLNAQCDIPIEDGCKALFYPSKCLTTVDPIQVNAVISEIGNLVKCAGIKYDCTTLDNLCRAISELTKSSIPPGALLPWTGEGVPSGYLKCNGAAVSRTVYADLFAAIGLRYGVGDAATTFNLPDYRGYFLRGLDEGRGVDPDSSRALGSVQGHDVVASGSTNTVSQTHDHGLNGNLISPNSQETFARTEATPNDFIRITDARTLPATMEHNHTVSIAGDGGGREVRPVNMAVIYLIKT